MPLNLYLGSAGSQEAAEPLIRHSHSEILNEIIEITLGVKQHFQEDDAIAKIAEIAPVKVQNSPSEAQHSPSEAQRSPSEAQRSPSEAQLTNILFLNLQG
ncbi:hypothetical protein [Nostoc sp. S13]|uniref:hypothetical protein n=1 Tax=Nostoc sp. S13 TaxID=3019266 RepID=UPI002606B01C|nr:hypothetical protein [Nostoc sp. S13]MDF5740071.1 hypothetical protein [Nostoc sp. S13]